MVVIVTQRASAQRTPSIALFVVIPLVSGPLPGTPQCIR
jgi:hypothetical protein